MKYTGGVLGSNNAQHKALYGFEVNSIQSYIIEGGKLVDLVAASGLVHNLMNLEGGDLVSKAMASLESLKELDIDYSEGDFTFLRRAGAALIIESKNTEALKRFRQVFTLLAASQIPGLSFQDALVIEEDGKTDLKKLNEAMGRARLAPSPAFPPFTTGMKRSPRTGKAAMMADDKRGGELMDESLKAKRALANKGQDDLLGQRCITAKDVLFPNNFDEEDAKEDKLFPFTGEEKLIGIIHADGNKLGSKMIALSNAANDKGLNAGTILSKISTAIAEATQEAVQGAFERHIKGNGQTIETEEGAEEILPARPIVMGGDDITMIIRADLALSWTVDFLKSFEKLTEEKIGKAIEEMEGCEHDLAKQHFSGGLSAGAGILYVSAHMPFDQAHHLCEGLASQAKKVAKESVEQDQKPPSTLSFYRATASVMDDFEDVWNNELTVKTDNRNIILSLNPYHISGDKRDNLPALDDLLKLVNLMNKEKFPNGPLREYAGLLTSDAVAAEQVWQRFLQVAKKRGDYEGCFTGILEDLGINEKHTCFIHDENTNTRKTPILDAITLKAVGDLSGKTDEKEG